MFDKFSDYMYYLLNAPLKRAKKETNDIHILFKVLGKICDDIKQDIFNLRRQSMILTSKSKALDELGKDRRMPRFSNETDEQYRKRLLMKREVSQRAGTKYGIIKALESMGYDDVIINPVGSSKGNSNNFDGNIKFDGKNKFNTIKKDTAHWAEFMVFLGVDNTESLNDLEIVKEVVREVKQASSLPVYGFRIEFDNNEHIEINQKEELEINNTNHIDTSLVNKLEIKNKNSQDVVLKIEKNLGYFDGTYRFDGSRKFNSEIIKEVL
jgi:hypothetical protein